MKKMLIRFFKTVFSKIPIFTIATGCCTFISSVGSVNADYVDLYDSTMNNIDTLSASNEYILHGCIFIDSGKTLVINPGTVIRGIPGTGVNISALIVARGGVLIAQGTPDSTIIFTAITDNIANPSDLGAGACGLWGGVIMCGTAPVDSFPVSVDELPQNTTQKRKIYGGTNKSNFSGVLSYVSIRYAGAKTEIGIPMPSLALCGVGYGSVVDHVEVINCEGDGICFRGGCVSSKYIISAFSYNNAFNICHGYRGKGQCWLSIQHQPMNNKLSPEHALYISGATDSSCLTTSNLTLYNATFIGPGSSSIPSSNRGQYAIQFSQRGAGKLYNLIVTGFPEKAFSTDSIWRNDSYQRLLAGDISLRYCDFWDIGKQPMSWAAITSHLYEGIYCSNSSNFISDPHLRCIGGPSFSRYFDPRQIFDTINIAPFTVPPVDDFYEPIGWIGSFGPLGVDYWIGGWTGLYQNRLCTKLVSIGHQSFETITNGNTQFDFFIFSKIPERGLIDSSILVSIDGKNVTAAFRSRCQNISLKDGGIVYKVTGLKTYEFGGSGIHNFVCRFRYDNGLNIADTLSVKILQ
jgi:hypothetical protein